MEPELTKEQQQALDHNQGFVRGASYVLMSIDVSTRNMACQIELPPRAEVNAIVTYISQDSPEIANLMQPTSLVSLPFSR